MQWQEGCYEAFGGDGVPKAISPLMWWEGAMTTSVLRDCLSTAHLLLCPSISQAQKSEVGVRGTEIGYQLKLCQGQNQFLISFKKVVGVYWPTSQKVPGIAFRRGWIQALR